MEIAAGIEELAVHYFSAINIPTKARIDAFHLATASWHGIEYLVSWNCKHIVSGRVRKIITEINYKLDIYTPTICTPEELMEI